MISISFFWVQVAGFSYTQHGFIDLPAVPPCNFDWMSAKPTATGGNDAYHWKNLLQSIPAAAPAYFKAFPGRLLSRVQNITHLPAGILNFHQRLLVEPHLRFITIAWCLVFIFCSVCFLSHSNPFQLFFPGSVASLPTGENRDLIQMYGVERDSFKIVPVERAMNQTGSLQARILRVAHTIQKPVGLNEHRSDATYTNLTHLPEFSNAIRHIWFIEDSGLVIIDLRDLSLETELNRFLAQKTVSGATRHKYMSSYFQAFTASIFVVDSKIKVVEYRLDGKQITYKDLPFNFAARYLAGL